eukprot:356106-Chlamydomonas_euryale.AAC.5
MLSSTVTVLLDRGPHLGCRQRSCSTPPLLRAPQVDDGDAAHRRRSSRCERPRRRGARVRPARRTGRSLCCMDVTDLRSRYRDRDTVRSRRRWLLAFSSAELKLYTAHAVRRNVRRRPGSAGMTKSAGSMRETACLQGRRVWGPPSERAPSSHVVRPHALHAVSRGRVGTPRTHDAARHVAAEERIPARGVEPSGTVAAGRSKSRRAAAGARPARAGVDGCQLHAPAGTPSRRRLQAPEGGSAIQLLKHHCPRRRPHHSHHHGQAGADWRAACCVPAHSPP